MHIDFIRMQLMIAKAIKSVDLPQDPAWDPFREQIKKDMLTFKDSFRDFFNDSSSTATNLGDLNGKTSDLFASAAEGLKSGKLTREEFGTISKKFQEAKEQAKLALSDEQLSDAEKVEIEGRIQTIADEINVLSDNYKSETPTSLHIFLARQLDRAKDSFIRGKDMLTHLGNTLKNVASGIDEGSLSIEEIEAALALVDRHIAQEDGGLISEEDLALATKRLNNADTAIADSRTDEDRW